MSLVEGGQAVALAELQVASVALERIDRQALDQFDLPLRVLELGELDYLHQILLDVDDVVEPVADQDAVGLDPGRHHGNLLRPGGEGREKQDAGQGCSKVSFHRCLNSFISSAT